MEIVTAIAIVILILICITAGVILAGQRSERDTARLAAQRWNLWIWEQELINAADVHGCPSCQLLRRREELHRPPAA
ncbi:MAG: hypothetical protein WCB04_00970 [Mycobacteriales bacterium]